MFLTVLPWAVFLALVAGMLALDLFVFNRHARVVKRREAINWSVGWIALALIFNAGVYVAMGKQAGIEWTAGYLVEKSLAVDNIFVFLLIFSAFAVPAQYQHRVLFWGVVGAVVLRALLIAAAGFLITTLHLIVYVFGAFLVFTGIKFLRSGDQHPDITRNPALRVARRFIRTTEGYEGHHFFVRRNGVLFATPLFLVLILVETSDVVFAVDSIPAIYAITSDPFIVFTSNIFAILGLRALYFVVAGSIQELRFLKPGLAALLVFVGIKMLLVDVVHPPALLSLGVIVAILGSTIAASLLFPHRPTGSPPAPVGEKKGRLAPETGPDRP